MFFWPSPQGDKLADWIHTKPSDPHDPMRFLYLLGPDEVALQVELLEPGATKTPIESEQRRLKYSHRYVLPQGLTREMEQMLNLLQEVLTLRQMGSIDFGLALDLYKVPEDGVDPYAWANTEAGDLNRRAKYNGSDDAFETIVDHMVSTIADHPLLVQVDALVTVPGSAGDGNSFGERLSREIAVRTDIPFAKTRSTGPREQAKTGGRLDGGTFSLPYELTGAVLILDDVVMSGQSMRAVAKLARAAGAEAVYALAGVKTLKNS